MIPSFLGHTANQTRLDGIYCKFLIGQLQIAGGRIHGGDPLFNMEAIVGVYPLQKTCNHETCVKRTHAYPHARSSGLASWNACGAHAVPKLVLLSSQLTNSAVGHLLDRNLFFFFLFIFFYCFYFLSLCLEQRPVIWCTACVFMHFAHHVMVVVINFFTF